MCVLWGGLLLGEWLFRRISYFIVNNERTCAFLARFLLAFFAEQRLGILLWLSALVAFVHTL